MLVQDNSASSAGWKFNPLNMEGQITGLGSPALAVPADFPERTCISLLPFTGLLSSWFVLSMKRRYVSCVALRRAAVIGSSQSESALHRC